MPDTFYQWLLIVLPVALALPWARGPKRFEKVGYRIAVGIFCLLYSVGTYIEIVHEKKNSAAEVKENGIETSARVSAELTKHYADTVSSQAQKIGELEGFIQSQGKDVRDVKKSTVASAAEVHALFAENQTGKQKKQDVVVQLNRYAGQSGMVVGECRSVGPPGSGGSGAQFCLDAARRWTSMVAG